MRRPSGSASSRSVGVQPAGPLDHPETAHEQVVDRARSGRLAQAEALAQRRERPGSRAGRRLKSPPRIERVGAGHSTAASGRGHASRLARSGRPAEACRFATQTRPKPGSSRRVHCIRRCSGRHGEPSAGGAPAHGPGGAPGSGWSLRRSRRSGPGSGPRGAPGARGTSCATSARARRSTGCGGELGEPARRRLLEQGDVPFEAVEHARELVEQRTVDLHVRLVRARSCRAAASGA